MTVNKNKIFSTLLLSLLIVPAFLALSPLQTAKSASDPGQDFLAGIGCNDTDKNGLDFGDCFSGGDSGVATSFTNFQGDLTPPDATGYAAGLTQAQDARTFILNVTNFALGFLGLIAVLVVIYGGVMSVTSAGNPEGANKGKKAITYAVIGLLVVMSSFALVNTVLLAPSGSEKGGAAATGINSNTIRGVAENAKFNYLASQIDADITKIYNSYQFHLNVKQKMDNVLTNIRAFDPTKTCDVPMSDCARQFDNLMNSQIAELTNTLNDARANTPFKIGMATLIDKINGDRAPVGADIIQLSKDEDCETLNSGIDVNPCTDDNKLKIRQIASDGQKSIADDLVIKAQSGTDVNGKTTNLNFLQAGYKQDLDEVYNDIANVYQTVGGLASVNVAKTYFENLLGANGSSDNGISKEFKATSDYLVVDKSLTGLPQSQIKLVLTSLVQIKALLANLKFVNTVLSADGVKGNAPYIVNFSTVGSSDPSGQAISNDRIHWDLNGDGEFNDTTLDGDVKCDATQTTIATCIFKKPGTYRVLVKIGSSDALDKATNTNFNQEIAPGIAAIDVQVNPPSTKINLKANGNPIIQYDNSGNLIEDHNQIYFTLAEAQKGIEFDASESQYSINNKIINDPNAKVRWDFGLPSTNNDSVELASLGNLKPTQVYNTVGNYQLTIEVTDKNGVADRKIVTVIVSNLAPRITNAPQKGLIGQKQIFDGSNSSTDGSPLIFNWKIEKLNVTPTAYLPSRLFAFVNQFSTAHAAALQPTGGSSSAKAPSLAPSVTLEPSKRSETNDFYSCDMPENKNDILECTFKKSGTYRVTLSLRDSDGKPYEETSQIVIASNPPSAGVKYSQLSKAVPAVFSLDGASLSFDPDESGTSNLEYSWEINPPTCNVVGYAGESSTAELLAAATGNTSAQTPCDKLKDFNPAGSSPVIKFTQKGNYTVNLVVRSIDEPNSVSTAAEQTITIENILDVAWGNMKASAVLQVPGASATPSSPDQDTTAINKQPVAPITFLFTSSQAVSYEMDYGDGESDSGEMTQGSVKSVVHNYSKVGKFTANLSVFDADDVENKIDRNIFIGDGNSPVSIVTTKVNDSEVQPGDVELGSTTLHNTIVVNRKDNLVFDAGQSLNTDGTGRRLIYAWNINNGEKQSTNKTLAYKFNNVSEAGEPYVIKLKSSDEKDPTKYGEDSVNILVVGAAPTLRSLTAVPDEASTTTPVSIKLNAVGAEDPDGQIVEYKWWYYDADAPATSDNRLGIQITTTPSASIVIGTRGLENEKPRYKFGVEMTDNDNVIVSTDNTNDDFKLNIKAPEVQVTNGPNKAPVAKFNVDRTSIQVGESVNFTSASFDPDQGGGIKEYKWDFGDGTKGNNASSVSHIYQKASVDGYKAKLTVVDTNSSEATSDSIRIFVDAVAGPPTAAFTSAQNAGGKSVQFTNTSKADIDAGASIKSYAWDFDVTIDSDGDGKKDNDTDSTETNPSHNYADYGIFRAKLTIQDNQGQSQSITNFVNVKPPVAPKPASTTASTGNNSANSSGGSGNSKIASNSKSVAADFFAAGNKVDPGLLIASIAAYAILFGISKMAKKQD